MFPLISNCAEQLGRYLQESANMKTPVEAKEVSGRFSTDVITSCAFGIDSNCFWNPNSEFRKFGRNIVEFSVYRSFEFMSTFMLPSVVKLINVKFFSHATTKFLREVFWNAIREREEKKIERADFMQCLIKLKNEDRNKKKSMVEKMEAAKETEEEKTSFGKTLSSFISLEYVIIWSSACRSVAGPGRTRAPTWHFIQIL
jgi:cytochrome P450 family 6